MVASKRVAAGRDHLVGAVHRADRRGQRTEARVLEGLARAEHRLLADHPGASHRLHVAVGVGDDPLAADRAGRSPRRRSRCGRGRRRSSGPPRASCAREGRRSCTWTRTPRVVVSLIGWRCAASWLLTRRTRASHEPLTRAGDRRASRAPGEHGQVCAGSGRARATAVKNAAFSGLVPGRRPRCSRSSRRRCPGPSPKPRPR